LAKVEVASSSLVTRSIKKQLPFGSCFFMPIGQNHLCDKLLSDTLKKNCHCEPARTLVWQSPNFSGRFVDNFPVFRTFRKIRGIATPLKRTGSQ
ncbi:MAG: hypothetical protein ACI4PL_02410, partial [Faecousia sp.]